MHRKVTNIFIAFWPIGNRIPAQTIKEGRAVLVFFTKAKGRLDSPSPPFVVEYAGRRYLTLRLLRRVSQWLIWKWATESDPWW